MIYLSNDLLKIWQSPAKNLFNGYSINKSLVHFCLMHKLLKVSIVISLSLFLLIWSKLSIKCVCQCLYLVSQVGARNLFVTWSPQLNYSILVWFHKHPLHFNLLRNSWRLYNHIENIGQHSIKVLVLNWILIY